MSDFTLANGQDINFDLSKMSYGEWNGLFDVKEPRRKSDITLARVCNITVKELEDIPFPEYRLLFAAFLKKTREPLQDPNA